MKNLFQKLHEWLDVIYISFMYSFHFYTVCTFVLIRDITNGYKWIVKLMLQKSMIKEDMT